MSKYSFRPRIPGGFFPVWPGLNADRTVLWYKGNTTEVKYSLIVNIIDIT